MRRFRLHRLLKGFERNESRLANRQQQEHLRIYTSITNSTAWKRNPTLCHPEEQTCLRQVKGAMNIGCPILRVLAKGGSRGCLPRDLFFPPLPKGHGKGGAPSLWVCSLGG